MKKNIEMLNLEYAELEQKLMKLKNVSEDLEEKYQRLQSEWMKRYDL